MSPLISRSDPVARARAKTADRAVREMHAREKEEAKRAERARRAAARARSRRAAFAVARRAAPAVGAAVPVAMVNATAFIGQFAYIRDHVPWTLPGQVLVAATFESVAIYLAWHAHAAKMRNDSSTRLVIGAQMFALIMGLMNYSHYSVAWRPTPLAVGLGLMSLLSPLLWGVHSKRASRDQLLALGLVEPHAVRLGANRWTWHPVRSIQVMYHSTWTGENHPQRAIGLYEASRAARQERRASKGAPAAARQAVPETGAPAAQPAPAIQQGGAPALGAPVQPAPAPLPQAPAGPAAPLPGTVLNGAPVLAIASLAAEPAMGAVHPIDPQREAEVKQHLAGLRADALPSQRKVSELLCPGTGHNHRRAAADLIDARRAQGLDPVLFPRRPRPLAVSTTIATPVANTPGGATAHG